jgi:hypothetical protein
METSTPLNATSTCATGRKGVFWVCEALHGELRLHHANRRSPVGHLHAHGSNVAQGVRIVIVHRDFGLAPAGVGGKVTSIRPPALS